ncbi:hypothetical protein SAMN05421820_110156 [Pedobacter steynii]|uniref:DUF5977 domain-containing protein n=1 Tax=Pedobacter steynii TaxID=430522 RepID=A0A1H0FEM8_9SPHI|nr:DUF5977 domain-containing protein [Pedobacter steynii]NQX42127.1 hypothetical protein [Pedobacter steynii]SDN93066.1 hypothetical protein SAMN05421820_110156 [Pedobacter steynii]
MIHNLSRIVTVVTLLFFAKTSFAQPRVVAESPQVSSIGRYWDIPVGGYTGTPDINLPLYKLQIGGLELPITMSYHASGVKVKDEASWVGLGWTLNVGGMINKVVNGEEDTQTGLELRGDLAWHGPNRIKVNLSRTMLKGFLSADKDFLRNIMFSPYNKTRYQYSDLMEGYKDLDFINMRYLSNTGLYLYGNDPLRATPSLIDIKAFGKNDFSPDLYLCNVNGMSGSWMYGLDNKPHEIKANNFKIEGGPSAWKITDAKGIQYHFNDYGKTTKLAKTYFTYTPGYALSTRTSIDSLADSTYKYNSNISSAYLNKMISPTGEEINIYYSKKVYSNYHTPTIIHNKEWMSGEFDLGGPLPPESLPNSYYNDAISAMMQAFPKPDDIIYTSTIEQSSVEEFYPDSITSRKELIKFIKLPRVDIPNGIRLSEIQIYSKTSQGLKLVKQILFDNDQYFALRAPSLKDTDKRLKLGGIENKGAINGQASLGDKFSFLYDNSPLPSKSNYNGGINNILKVPDQRGDNQDNYGYISYLNTPYNVYRDNIDVKNNQAGILQKIIYPTGGYMEYKYESNRYDTGDLGAGLRVKETTLKMGDSLLLKQEYSYIHGTQLTFNQFTNKQEAFKVVMEYKDALSNINARAITYNHTLSTAPYRSINLGGYGSDLFVYANIEVSEMGSVNKGKTSYQFSTSDNDFKEKEDLIRSFSVGTPVQDMPSTYPLGNFISFNFPQIKYSSSLGNLLKKTVFRYSNDGYKKVLEEENKYLTNAESRGPDQTTKENSDLPVYRKSSLVWDLRFSSMAPDKNNPGVSVTTPPPFPGEFGARGFWSVSSVYLPPMAQGFNDLIDDQMFMLTDPKVTKRYWYPSQILMNNISPFYKKIAQTTVRTYDMNDDSKFVEQIKKFDYDTAEDIDANKITDILSKENTLEHVYLYAKDARINQLDAKHILSEVVESSVYNTSNSIRNLISLEKNTYYPDRPLLFEKLKLDVPKNLFNAEFIINKYDANSNVLEVSNSAGVKKAYRWNKAKTFPIAECINATESEFFYESFEDNGVVSDAHTGVASFNGSYNTASFFTKPENGRKYLISYWYVSNGAWKHSGDLIYSGQVLTGTLDDIRIFPENSGLSTYTYDSSFGITSRTDERNYTTFYNYDEFGRLKNTKDQNQNIIKTYDYNYSTNPNWVDVACNCLIDQTGVNTGQVTKTQKNFNPRSGVTYNTLRSVTITDREICPFINARLTQLISKNDCTEGTGSKEEYTIPAGQYSSLISQQDADSKALQSISTLGQAFANQNGVCTASFKVENFVNDNNSTITVKFTNISTLKVYEVTAKGGGGVNAKRNISIPGGNYKIEIKALGISAPFSAIALNSATANMGYTTPGTIINYTFNNQLIVSGVDYNIIPITELP